MYNMTRKYLRLTRMKIVKDSNIVKRGYNKLYNKYKLASPRNQHLIRGGTISLLFGICGVIVLISSFANSSSVTGVVYRDFNGNGRRDNTQVINPSLASDRGVGGITVKGFSSDGQLCDTQVTNSAGEYMLDMASCSGTRFRVEFADLPSDIYPAPLGIDNKSTTQFVNPGDTANLGVYRPGEFCQNNPALATSCYSFGEMAGPNSANGAIFGFPFNISGTTPPPMTLGTNGQTGTTWGLAYRQSNNTLYSGAFMKRHADFGPGGPGAIYASPVPASGTGVAVPSWLTTIPNAGTDPHPVSETNCNSRDGQVSANSSTCWARDEFSFDKIGKSGLGGVALISDQNNPSLDALAAINMNDRKIYKVSNLDTVQSSTAYDLPLDLPNTGPSAIPLGNSAGQHRICNQNDVRPFAVTIYEGIGYVGLVCSAQTSRDTADLRAYIYSFNPMTMIFATSPTLEFPLDYGRSCSNGNNNVGCWQRANWLPWISTFDDPLVNNGQPPMGNGVKIRTAPQPMLSDITFGTNGSMTIGLRDRYGDQMGYQALNTNSVDGTLYIATSTGDMLRACLVNGAYVMEDAGQCDGKGPGSGGVHAVVNGLPQGPGGYEFYNFDFFEDDNGDPIFHDESVQGGLAQVPGFDTVVSSNMNPLRGLTDGIWSGGLRWYNSEDGTKNNAYRLYQSNYQNAVIATPYFGKSNGIGDITAICRSAPIEVGDLVWKDTNSNGVQDANEPAIPGVTVTLVNSTGGVIATAVTDENGNYLFSNRVQDEDGNTITSTPSRKYGITNLTANTQDFRLELSTEADYSSQSRLQNLSLTTADVTVNNGNSQNDSNANVANSNMELSATNPAVLSFSTGISGANNHTLDFGFVEPISIDTPIENTTSGPSNPAPPTSIEQVTKKTVTTFANTGQALIASVITAIVLLCCGVGYFIWIRRR